MYYNKNWGGGGRFTKGRKDSPRGKKGIHISFAKGQVPRTEDLITK